MFDQAQRSMWLEDQLWHRLRDTFPALHELPTEVLITMGAHQVGNDGTLSATPDTQAKLDALRAEIGDPPAGFGMPFPVRSVQRTRLRKYVCSTKYCNDSAVKHVPIRAASDTLDVHCTVCGNPYIPA